MSSFNQEFRTETWTLYAVGMFIIAVRLVILWYTVLVVSINKIIFGGGSNFMTPEEEAALTPQTRQERIEGSKWVLVSEEVMVLTIWTCKVCMLLIYKRLTEGLKQAKLINAVFVWVAVGFVGTQIAMFTTCRPFSGYWSVPAIDSQCWSYYDFEIVEAIFNISADIAVLLVAIPLLFKIRVPIQQMAVLITIFGMGAFVIAAAVLTKVYSLDPALVSYSYLNWYFREASVSVYVTNLPAIWALLRDTFPVVKRWGYPAATSYAGGTGGSRTGKAWPSHGASRNRGKDVKNYTMQMFERLGSANEEEPDIALTQSQERIIQHPKDPRALEINKDDTFSVSDDVEAGTVYHASNFPPTSNYKTDITAP